MRQGLKLMDKLIKCFDYLKPYHADMLDAIGVMLELFILKTFKPNSYIEILKLNKNNAQNALNNELRLIIDSSLFIPLNPNINAIKILKTLINTKLSNEKIEVFLHTITQKKTTNKLYFYSTPCEINRLIVGLLGVKENDLIYNPCYGMGSVFLSLANLNTKFSLYGEELDSKLSIIAKLIAQLCNIDNENLYVNDVLMNPVFNNKKFDKIICNPPLHLHIGTELIKYDTRFSKLGIPTKIYPELSFLTHSLSYLKNCGVFIVRNQVLIKSTYENKLRDELINKGMIEAIIELPKNVFPHQSNDFSILVVSHNNKEILHIDASSEYFFEKDGKYNKLIKIEEILDIFKHKKQTRFSLLTPLKNLNINDLRAHSILDSSNEKNLDSSLSLASLNVEVFRGQRIVEAINEDIDKGIEFFDIGIIDFAPYGFSEEFNTKKKSLDKQKVQKYRIKSYDILLSLRGVKPRLTIIGDIGDKLCLVNAGIIVLRTDSKESAIAIYCYLFSQMGEKSLKKIYENANERSVDIQKLLALKIPKNYKENTQSIIQKLNNATKQLKEIESSIESLKKWNQK